MFEIICLLTGMVILAGGLTAFARTRDALHPAIICLPPFFYMYCIWPILLNRRGGLEVFFTEGSLEYAALVFLLSILMMYLGMSSGTRDVPRRTRGASPLKFELSPALGGRLFWVALVVGVISLAAYWHMIDNAGGFVMAYSRAKGGGWAASGYIGEATLLSFPALFLLTIAIRAAGRRVSLQDIMLALVIVSPQLLQGTFGGRRGPLFLTLAALFFAWFIARNKWPSLRLSILGICICGLAVIAVQSQRGYIYLGSEEHFDSSRIWEKIAPEQVVEGNTYLAAVGAVQVADYFNDYYWGYRYFVTLFVRPIPKQIWPTKYEDVGADWIHKYHNVATRMRFQAAVGMSLPSGSATGSIADGYQEFWWGVLLMFYLIGRAFAFAWRQHRLQGGYSTILFFLMLILSIYLPTQSFSAWMLRVLIMAIPCYLVWRFWIGDVVVPRPLPGSSHPRKQRVP